MDGIPYKHFRLRSISKHMTYLQGTAKVCHLIRSTPCIIMSTFQEVRIKYTSSIKEYTWGDYKSQAIHSKLRTECPTV